MGFWWGPVKKMRKLGENIKSKREKLKFYVYVYVIVTFVINFRVAWFRT
jgi:hypothetical protein